MNHHITPTRLVPLLPACAAIAASRGVVADKFELEDTVLRAGGFAWDIGAEAALLHAQIATVFAAEKAAREAAEAARLADELANPRPYRVSKDTIMERLKAAGKAADARALYLTQNAQDRWEFDQAGCFSNKNARIRGFAAALGLDPDVILARDEFAM